ncbi:MAG: SPW repeat protein [Allomuricauda sp.]
MWTIFINIILGIWLMAAPTILGYGPIASDNGHIVGPIIVTFSTISLWEATNAVRKWNYPFALWLLLAPWILEYDLTIAIISDMLIGAMVFAMSTLRSSMKNRYGGGWTSLWKKYPDHMNDPME